MASIKDVASSTPKTRDDSDYLSDIVQYKSKSWYDQLLANPWLNSRQDDFSPNLLQSVGEAFGDYGARDQYWAQIRQNRNQWLSDKVASLMKQDYDSNLSQVQRQQQAGINSDLAMSSTPGEGASPSPESLPNVDMARESGVAQVFNLANDILGFSMGFLSNLQGLKAQSLQIHSGSLAYNNELSDTAWRLISEGTDTYLNGLSNPTGASVETIMKDGKFWSSLNATLEERIDNLPYSRRERKHLKSMVDQLIWRVDKDSEGFDTRSFTAKYEKMVTDLLTSLKKSKHDYTESSGLIGSEGNLQDLEFIGKQIYKPLNDLSVEVAKLISNKDKEYLSTFNELHGGRLHANAETVGYSLQSSLSNVKLKVTRAFDAINRKIAHSMDISPTWKLALQAGVAAAESKFLVSISQPFGSPSLGVNFGPNGFKGASIGL